MHPRDVAAGARSELPVDGGIDGAPAGLGDGLRVGGVDGGGGSGVRVVLDARPLQDAERAPTTAAYIDGLLTAYDAAPLPGESFALLLQSDLEDPTLRLARLDVVGRRLLPPTRYLRSGALVVDPFLLTGATLGAAWRADRGGAAGAVYHATGGIVPALTSLPTVVTLLDLAPWELPDRFSGRPLGAVGQGLRTRLLRRAAAVIVASDSTAAAARRLLGIRRSRLHVIPLAPRPAFLAAAVEGPGRAGSRIDARTERERLGLPARYFVYSGRYDARQDLPTLLAALAALAASGRPARLRDGEPWPPRVLLVGASPDDRAALAKLAARHGIGDAISYAPRLEPARLAALVRGARAAVLPVLVESAGLAAIEALACGTPVIASEVGVLPELVGTGGLVVPPKDPDRLAVALSTAWTDDAIRDAIAAAARAQSERRAWTWADVAIATRAVYRGVTQAAP